jgi:invasion protein IalB
MTDISDGRNIKIKIDDKDPVTYKALSSSDGSSTYVFVSPVTRLVKQLKGAKTMVIEAEFYQSGLKQMEFNVKDFKWNY